MRRVTGRWMLLVASCVVLVACGSDAGSSTESDSAAQMPEDASVDSTATLSSSATTTTYPLPTKGTVPSSDISRLQSGDDVTKAAKIARVAWIPTHDPSCYESDTELNAALDEFGRLPLYMGNLMRRAKELGDIDAYVAVNNYRKEAARWNPLQSVGLCSAPSTTTTLPSLPRPNVDANGARSVTLATEGPYAVDAAFTTRDDSAACDGRSPATRFWLMRYDEALLDWVADDFARPKDAATSVTLTPTQPGTYRIEYFAYCGTQDIRYGTTEVSIPGLDVTAGPTATTSADTDTKSIYAIVANASPSVTLRGDATHVIVEPQAAIEWLDGSPTGTVTVRVDGGPWAILSTRFATIVPVGTSDGGIEVDVVGPSLANRTTVNVADTTTTTQTPTTLSTDDVDANADAPNLTAAVVEESTDAGGDATLWVILGLVGLAAAAVFLARLRLL